jgi:uncharacterized membrane protein YeaQ/YmgE (transglycosylase-associated protein family)
MSMIAYIALGGIVGTVARYLVQGDLQTRGGTLCRIASRASAR